MNFVIMALLKIQLRNVMTENSSEQPMEKASSLLDDVKIVLCQTSHPGNIGAAARAMKTMGLSQLVLFNPKHFPSEEASTRASSARDILDNAQVVDTFAEAIADCRLVIGASSRNRSMPWPMLNPKEMASMLVEQPEKRPIALVFGREATGLLNDELQQCHYHLNIPANPDYMSLNLAAAVQVIAYEVRMASLADSGQLQIEDAEPQKSSEQTATSEEVEGLYQHMAQVMEQTEFFDPQEPKLLPARVRRILAKAQVNVGEVQVLRGFMASITKHLKRSK